jgi:glucose/arabinose dehydrogenase
MQKILTLFFTIILATAISSNLRGQLYIGSTAVDTNTVITGLDVPWEIQYGSDGWLWLTERFGRVSRVHPETGEQDIILNISSTVHQSGESGLLGMAFHPQFPDDSRVYLVYTYLSGGIKERLVHFTWDGEALTDETILIDAIPGNSTHNGSRLLFAPDGKLLMTTGDAQQLSAPQNLNSLLGKTLRLNDDGSIPADNPFAGSYVYTYGHRNAQGLFLAPDGTLYSSEHGPSSDDEINILEAGRNYGWPDVNGYCNTPSEIEFCNANNVKEPITTWTPTIAPGDIVYYHSDAIPEWKGSILLTVLKNKRLVELKLTEDGQNIADENHYFNNYWGRLRDICVGPQGEIYLATNGNSWSNTDPFTHSIIRIMPQNSTGTDQVESNSLSFQVVVPAAGNTLILDLQPSVENSFWTILNLSGQVVKSGFASAGQSNIQHNLTPGMYFFVVENQSDRMTQKFIVR